ncbi:MAG: DUF1801 domain-containing protein [Solirubrobacteraceae bacterium]|nr:DUF1801 domain-containing protein [Solirubrobacteraceae bacterium]
MHTKPESPETYLASLDPERRARLETIRRVITETAPDATEAMVYGMPGFRLGDKPLAAYAATKKHDGFYPCSGQVITSLPEIGARFSTTAGAVHLPLDQPIPEDVVALLVRTRIGEIAARGR